MSKYIQAENDEKMKKEHEIALDPEIGMVSLGVTGFDPYPNDLLSKKYDSTRIMGNCKHDSRLEMDYHSEPSRLVSAHHGNFQLDNDVQYTMLKRWKDEKFLTILHMDDSFMLDSIIIRETTRGWFNQGVISAHFCRMQILFNVPSHQFWDWGKNRMSQNWRPPKKQKTIPSLYIKKRDLSSKKWGVSFFSQKNGGCTNRAWEFTTFCPVVRIWNSSIIGWFTKHAHDLLFCQGSSTQATCIAFPKLGDGTTKEFQCKQREAAISVVQSWDLRSTHAVQYDDNPWNNVGPDHSSI